jgi:hypothetical protein
LAAGGRAWLRHAKPGELCERFTQLHQVEGDRVTETVPTYRATESRSADQAGRQSQQHGLVAGRDAVFPASGRRSFVR